MKLGEIYCFNKPYILPRTNNGEWDLVDINPGQVFIIIKVVDHNSSELLNSYHVLMDNKDHVSISQWELRHLATKLKTIQS